MMTHLSNHRLIGALFLLPFVLAVASCAGASSLMPPPTDTPPSSPPPAGERGFWLAPSGPTSLKERIARADVIARVRLQSVAAGTERWIGTGREHAASPKHVGTLEHRFRVVEYLKGTGDGEVVAVVFELNHEGPRDSEAQALADGNALLAARDARWDAREALVFLQDHHRVVPDLPRAGRYLLGYVETIRGVHFDVYSLGSRWDKLWLPSSSPGGAAGAAGASAEQRFLLDVPAAGSEASSTRSVRSGGTPTITLAAMKAEVAGIEQEIAAGGGSDAYRDCLYEKYRWEREVSPYAPGSYYYKRYDENLASGQPAGTFVYSDLQLPVRELGQLKPNWGEYRIIGRDHALFVTDPRLTVNTARPLPAGEYKFNPFSIAQDYIICDALPEKEKRRFEIFVTVTAPAGTLHEALFDPAAIGTAVGADGTNGVVEPAGFTVGGTATTVDRR